MSISVKPRERDAILQSLRSGVVPRVGLRHLQVGRRDEVAAILDDLQHIEQGGASIRFRRWSKITVPKRSIALYCYYGKCGDDFQCPAEVSDVGPVAS
jgi:hypothetical protein